MQREWAAGREISAALLEAYIQAEELAAAGAQQGGNGSANGAQPR